MSQQNAGERASREYWNDLWDAKAESHEIGYPHLRHWEAKYAALFDRVFSTLGDTKGKRLLEVGAGDSGWLPYFVKRYGFDVTGLDYSPAGCQRAATLAERAGVTLNVVLGDMFSPPPDLEGAFDVVFSNGLVEHFEDTARALQALSRFLRPDGLLLTLVPNLSGILGLLQRSLNRPVYDIHVPIDVVRMRSAHVKAGFEVLSCENLMSINLGVVNLVGLDASRLMTRLKRVLVLGMIAFSRTVWAVERVTGDLPAVDYLSPYVAAVARKDGS